MYWPSINRFRRFASKADWHVSWLDELATQDSGDSTFICDGPGVIETVGRVDRDKAIRVGQIHTNHFAEYPFGRGARYKPLYETYFSVASSLDALVVLTQHQADDLRAELGSWKNLFVIPNIITTSPPERMEKITGRVSLFSRLAGPKAVDEAIAAFQRVIQEVPDATLEIFGEGTRENELQRLIDIFGLNSRVKLRGHTKEPLNEMAKSVCTVLTSKYEGFSFAIAESMLSGTPPVAYNCNYGPADLITQGVDGFLVPLGDVGALAEKIVYLLQNPNEASDLGESGSRKIALKYTGDEVLHLWEDLFSSVSE